MGDSVKSLAEVEVDNIQCSPLIYLISPHLPSHSCHHRRLSDWSSKSSPWWIHVGNLLFLHLLRDDIQNELFYHLSRGTGEADWPVVPWVLLLALFAERRDAGLPPVLGHFCPPGPFKDGGEWLSNVICQLPQRSWVYPIGAHGFVGIQIA